MYNKIVDLRSDTVTKPSKGMIEYMMQAVVGDDVFGEDATVNSLEQSLADMFGKEAALFMPSGTMSNQIAIQCHTMPLQQIVVENNAHILHYENGGYAYHSGVSAVNISTENNKLCPSDILSAIHADYDWLPTTAMVSIENTVNRAGGICYDANEIQDVYAVC